MIQHRSILFTRKGRVFMAAGVRLNFHSVEEMEEYLWCLPHVYMVVLGTCMVDVFFVFFCFFYNNFLHMARQH